MILERKHLLQYDLSESYSGYDKTELGGFKIDPEYPFFIIITDDVEIINLKIDEENYNVKNWTDSGVELYKSFSWDNDDFIKTYTGKTEDISIIKINLDEVENNVEKLLFYINNKNNKYFHYTYLHNGQMTNSKMTGTNLRLSAFYQYFKKWRLDPKEIKIESIQYDITNYLKDGFFISK